MVENNYTPEWTRKDKSRVIQTEPFAFFRDDDVGYENNLFCNLADYFISKEIFLNIALIPTQIKNLDSKILNILEDPHVDILQHGFDHSINYLNKNGGLGEFHQTISYKVNEKKLRKGWEIIINKFDLNIKGFCPPWHNYPQIDLLLDLNYEVISGYGDKIELIENSILSLPVNVDIIKDYSKKRLYHKDILLRKCKHRLKRCGFLGLLLHHNYMGGEYHEHLDKVVQYLRQKKIPILKLSSKVQANG